MSSSPEDHLETIATESARLDQFLARAFPDVSRSRFQALIADGQVTVEGAVIRDRGIKLRSGNRVVVTIPEARPAMPDAEAIPLSILHEDDAIIVIDKPAGLVVHPGAGQEDGTLVNALLAHCGDSLSGIGGVKRPGIVHRLDKDTSGVLVVAKTDAAHKSLSSQFAAHGRDGRLQRSYVAFVWGGLPKPRGSISAPLARSSANRQKIAVSQGASAREAITHYRVEHAYGRPPLVSKVQCRLETGRTHQIRVHMTHIGHPLLGDKTYGSGFATCARKLADEAQSALKTLNRQALHARSLGFEHPLTGRKMVFESPLPADLARLEAALDTDS
jgi:23S rRNA pseudouridine1911/1915/1917 synthase